LAQTAIFIAGASLSARYIRAVRLGLVLAAACAVAAFGLGRAYAQAIPLGCRGLVLVSARTGAVERRFPDLPVSSAVSDGRGGWFATAGNLLRLRSDGRVDATWRPKEVGGPLERVVRVESRLYATDGKRVYAYDASSGRLVWASGLAGGIWRNGVRPAIYALRADALAVYVGGSFGRFAGAPRTGVAALDAATGGLRDWRLRLQVGQPGPSVVALGLGSGHLYAASPDFADGTAPIAGRAHDHAAARVSLLSGGFVDDILVSHGIVFVGGHEGRPPFSASTGRPVSRLRGVRGSVFAADGSLVYLGGNLRDSSSGADNLGAVNLGTGRLTGWGPSLAKFVSVTAIAPSDGKVLVAGSFCRSIG
jgi:PQQ-like domain